DKLLDLSINGHLSDEEFAKRNRQFNSDIESLEARLANLEEEESKNKEISLTVETLRKLIADELDFSEGFDNAIVDSLLNRIEVFKTDDKKVIDLKIYFKVLNDEMKYRITRNNGTSVCSVSHT
ncbi:MAG: recombinase family protein, partial [Clostridiales bacterium]|nr:recombinase family protein [Clostridiales bacterium]